MTVDPACGNRVRTMIHGGVVTAGNLGNLDHASSGISNDAAVTQSAFNQTITMWV